MLKPNCEAKEFKKYGFKRCKGTPKERECLKKKKNRNALRGRNSLKISLKKKLEIHTDFRIEH